MDKRLELTPQQIAQKYVDEIKTRRLKYKSWLTIMLLMICQTVCGQFVYDRSNMTIGRAKGIPITYAAVYFFFNKFGN